MKRLETTVFGTVIGEDFELVHAHYKARAFPKHFHDTYSIATILEGAQEYRHGKKTEYAPTGTIVLSHPGETHANVAVDESGWRCSSLYLDGSLLECNGRSCPYRKPRPY